MSDELISSSAAKLDDTGALHAEQLHRLEHALERLHPRDRDIFLAASRDKLPHAEIAQHHRMHVAKVQRIIARVLVRLHEAVWTQAKPRSFASRIVAVFYAAVRRR